uniref:Uncharacterized protein n=1 Tax=Triticum urartu TaxID=4572 RepID=A0A8R7QYL4_TRIUA
MAAAAAGRQPRRARRVSPIQRLFQACGVVSGTPAPFPCLPRTRPEEVQ